MTKNNIFSILDRHPFVEKSVAIVSTLAMVFSFGFSPNLLVAETAPVEVVEVAETIESDLPQEVADENSDEVESVEADEAVGDDAKSDGEAIEDEDAVTDTNNEEADIEAGDDVSGGSSGSSAVESSDRDISERDSLIRAVDPDFADFSLEELKNFSGPGMCLRSDNLGDTEKVQLGSNPNEPTLQEIFDDYSNSNGTPNLDVFEDQVNHQIGRVRLIDGKNTSDFNGNGNVGIKDLQMLLTSWGDCDNNEDCQTDLNGDGRVDRRDLRILLALWGSDGSFSPLKADVNKDGFVNTTDRDLLVDMFGPCTATDCQGDINGDQVVDEDDLRILVALFGAIKSDSLFLIFELDYVAKFAGNSNVFGWYRNSDLSSFEPIFQVGNHSGYSGIPTFDPGFSPGSAIVVEIPYLFDGDYTQSIGFAVDSENGSSSMKFATERSLNEGNSRQSLVYEFKETDLMVAFEDITFNSSDKDFNDMIVRVKAIGCSLESENEKILTQTMITNSDELEAEDTIAGEPYIVRWSVTAPAASITASSTMTGSVKVTDGTGAECVGDVGDGECEITSTTTGSKNIVASYSGDDNYRSSDSSSVSHTVTNASTTSTISSIEPSPSVLGELYTVSWTIDAVPPGSGQPTGMVTVMENDITACEASVMDGSCDIMASSTGEKSIVAVYQGDNNFFMSTSTAVSHQVNEGSNGGGGGGGNNNNGGGGSGGGGSSGGGSSSGGFIGGDPFGNGLVLGEEFDLLKQKRLELLGLMQRMLGLLQDEVNRRRLAGNLQGTGGGSLSDGSGFVLGDVAEAQEVEEDVDVVEEEEETVLPINEIDEEETQNRWWLWLLIILVLAAILYFLFRKNATARA